MKQYLVLKRIYTQAALIATPILLWQIYLYNALPKTLCKLSGFASTALILVYTFNTTFLRKYKSSSYGYWVRLILVSCFIASVMSYIFWGQSFDRTFRAIIGLWGFSYFFFLKKLNPTKSAIVRSISVLAIIYILLWFYALSKAPQMIFGFPSLEDSGKLVSNRGIYRLVLQGVNIVVLFYFYILSKAMEKKNVFFILCAVFLFLFNCGDLTRFKIAALLIVTIFFFYKKYKRSLFKLAFIISLSIGIIYIVIYYLFYDTFNILSTLTSSQLSGSGKVEDTSDMFWRAKEYAFFVTEFKNNFLTMFFGVGDGTDSALANYFSMIKQKHQFYPDDVGYAFLYLELGIFGLYCFYRIFKNVFTQKVSADQYYLKLFIGYICLSSVTLCNYADSIPICLALYLLSVNKKERALETKQ